ncbi:tape measure protein [Leminorella grimontii]|uniref:tape measure protein n=1 Tax=Leminorella grimontii TaxID=82981 RepID=UPI00208828D7|nr:tape measure protein [Leminorella grimontii]GKX60642.1 hypothetical protein SOASR031_29570 [Leminorella grimontii]
MANSANVGNITYQVELDVRNLLTGQQLINQRLGQLERGFNSNTQAVNKTQASMLSLSKVAASLAAALSVKTIAEYAESWTVVNNKLANSIREHETLAEVVNRVFDVAQNTRASLDATATLYARLERATRQYNTSAEDLVKLTSLINQGFVVSGATAQETANAVIQLSQGLASGVLRGEEYNSVAENGSRLAQALASSLGVTLGQLRAMAADGKLTTQVVVDGLLKQGDAIGKEFANTVTTMGQAFTVAGNNITKFIGESTTVQSAVSVFNNSIVTITENLDNLTTVITAVGAVVGSRYVGALLLAAKEQIKLAITARETAVAAAQEAKQHEYAANIALRKAQADATAANTAVLLAQAEYNAARGSNAEALALQNLIATKTAATTSSIALTTAERNQAVATTTAASAARSASLSMGALKGALALIGGPAGAAMLAGAAIYYFYQRSQEARAEALAFADTVDTLVEKLDTLSQAQLAASQAKLLNSIDAQKNSISELESELFAVNEALKKYADGQVGYTDILSLRIRAEGTEEELLRKQKILMGDIEAQTNKLKSTTEALTKTEDTLTTKFSWMGRVVSSLAQEMKGFDNSLPKPSTAEIDELNKSLTTLKNKLAVATLEEKGQSRQAAMLAAAQKIAAGAAEEHRANIMALAGGLSVAALSQQGMTEEVRAFYNQVADVLKLTGDLSDSQKNKGGGTDQNAEAIKDLAKQLEVARLETKGLAEEAEVLSAVQSLGANATAKQIEDVKTLTRELIKERQLKADIAAAEEADAEKKENKTYSDTSAQLKRQLDAQIITQQQYNAQTEQLEQQHQINLARIRAEAASGVTPLMQAQGAVDPIQALANEHAQKLALIQQFETQKGAITQRGLELMNAANFEYEQQRLQAQEELFRKQSEMNEFMMSMVDAVGQRTTNMITGIITGTQSAQDAFRNLAATILDQAVGALVQMGMQQVKNMIMGEVANATAATSAAATGASITASMAPAAAAASVATMGTAATFGLTAMTSAIPAMIGLFGKRKNGGPVSAGGAYQVGEGGLPEIFRASNGNQYMIPGDNGSVISNKDMQGGSSSPSVNIVINNTSPTATVENQGYNPDTKTITLAVKEVARQLSNRTGEVSRGLEQGYNVTGKAQ